MPDRLETPSRKPNQPQRQARVVQGVELDPLPAGLKRGLPLVPSATIAGRALVTVVAILTFLAALTASAAQFVANASQDWRANVSREITIQVRPIVRADIESELGKAAAIARAATGVESVRIVSKADAERLLEPWLGTGLDLVELPIPRLIVVKLSGEGRTDLAALKRSLNEKVTGASLDDHRLWIARLAAMANTVIALGIAVVGLVLTATALAVGFATRGALAGAKDIVEVLHFVGADDAFIAREFQSRFLKLGLRGGLVGGGGAAIFIAMIAMAATGFGTSAGGDQIEAMFGSIVVGWSGYAAILAIVGIVAAVTAIVSRLTVRRQLRGLN
jgi:cell division transport system permease protein